MTLNADINKYDRRIILMISLLAFGLVGAGLQPIRLVGLFFLPSILSHIFYKKINKAESHVTLIFAFYIALVILSLLWSWDRVEGIKQAIYYLCHFSIFLGLCIWSKKALNPLRAIMIGWGVFLCLTLSIALYEIFTFNHLPMDIIEPGKLLNIGGDLMDFRYASVTFGNLNTYNTVLIFALNLFVFYFFLSKQKSEQFIFLVIIFCSLLVLFVNGSRGAILSIILLMAFFLVYLVVYANRIRNLHTGLLAILVLIGGIFLFSEQIASFGIRFLYRIGEGGGSLFSDDARFMIYKSIFSALRSTEFLGFGAGGETAGLTSVGSGITASHNLILEVLLELGLPGFILFILFLLNVYKGAFSYQIKLTHFIVMSAVVIFPFLFVINSGYLLMPATWVYFASLFVISNSSRLNRDVCVS